MERFSRSFSQRILEAVKWVIQDSKGRIPEDIVEDLAELIRMAVDLDRDMCTQAARIAWIFPSLDQLVRFDADRMTSDIREAMPQAGQDVRLVLAPALSKQGKSTGRILKYITCC